MARQTEDLEIEDWDDEREENKREKRQTQANHEDQWEVSLVF